MKLLYAHMPPYVSVGTAGHVDHGKPPTEKVMNLQEVKARHLEMSRERGNGLHFTTNYRDEKSLRQLHKDRAWLIERVELLEARVS